MMPNYRNTLCDCCGNCKHFRRDYSDAYCGHRHNNVFDKETNCLINGVATIPEEHFVCDLFEPTEELVPHSCFNCCFYDGKYQYCKQTDTSICRSVAEHHNCKRHILKIKRHNRVAKAVMDAKAKEVAK